MSENTPTQTESPIEGPSDAPEVVSPNERPLPPPRRAGLIDLMILIAVIALMIKVGLGGLGFPSLSLLSVLTAISTVAGGIAMFIKGRSVGNEPMLWVVASACERSLPLEPGVEACGELSNGPTRRRANAVIEQLRRGHSIGRAFGEVRKSLPAPGLILIRMGWDGPLLATSLQDLMRTRLVRAPLREFVAGRLTYFVWTLFIIQLVVGLVLYWVVPQFQAIFADFGVGLPKITQEIINYTNLIMYNRYYSIAWLCQLAFLPILPLFFFDPLYWGIDPIDRVLMRRHGAMVLRALAGEVEMERPIAQGLERLSKIHPSRLVRQRLGKASDLVNRGRPWTKVLTRMRFLRKTDAMVLEAATRAGNLPWAMRDLAETAERRFSLRVLAWSQVLFPLAVIAVGLAVFAFSIGLFLPLTTLIWEFAQ